jgi:hypothetical protein
MIEQHDHPPFWRVALDTTGGLLLWGGHLGLVYGATAVACARGRGAVTIVAMPVVPVLIGLSTFVGLAATVVILARATRAGGSPGPAAAMLRLLAAMLAGVGFLGIAWTGLAALLSPGC